MNEIMLKYIRSYNIIKSLIPISSALILNDMTWSVGQLKLYQNDDVCQTEILTKCEPQNMEELVKVLSLPEGQNACPRCFINLKITSSIKWPQ